MSVVKLDTKADFDKAIKENDRVAIDFFATWCGPCKVISPKFENFAKEYTDIKFFKVDVDENDEAAQAEEINAMPTFKFYIRGTNCCEVVGASEAKLKEKLEELKTK